MGECNIVKKLDKLFVFYKIFLPLHSLIKGTSMEIWCNGSTTDSGSVNLGSTPGIST